MICLLHIRGLRRRILSSVHFRLLTSRYRNFQVATGRNQDSASCYGQHKARGLMKHPHLHLMGASNNATFHVSSSTQQLERFERKVSTAPARKASSQAHKHSQSGLNQWRNDGGLPRRGCPAAS